MAVIDFFDQGWRRNPHGTAYVLDDRSYSFTEARELSCRIANALAAARLTRGAKVAVWSLNDPIAWIVVLGTWRAGMTWVPINPRSSMEENVHILEAFDCEALFYQKGFSGVVQEIRPRLSKLKVMTCLDAAVGADPSLSQFIAGAAAVAPEVDHQPDDVVMLGATGGTTGLPKGVMNTNRNIQTFVAQYSIAASYRPGERVVNLAAAPMTHTAGNVSLPTTAKGGTVVILTRPEPAALLDAIERHRVTELFLPPTVIYMLLDHPGVETRDFSSLRYFFFGAAPMSVEKLRRAFAVFGPVMMQGYGQMEAFASITALPPEEYFSDGKLIERRLSSCGRPLPLTSVAILDEAKKPLAAGQAGEICVKGDIVMKGYYKAPEKTSAAISEGWLHTGDIGYLDEEGFLHITDRKNDLIISGGFNVYPSEVEQVIWAHPAVQDCAVIGVPDEKWGEAVKAVVELNPGMCVEAGELIALCRQRLGPVKAPKSIDFVARLPRSPNGKVLKKDVRAVYWQGTGRRI